MVSTLQDGRQVTIRPIVRSDLEAIRALYLEVDKESRKRWGKRPLGPWGWENATLGASVFPSLERKEKKHYAFVAVDKKGEVVAYIRAHLRPEKEFTSFHKIMIREDWRGIGLFDALTKPMIEISAAMGKTQVNFSVISRGAMPYYQRQWHAQETSRKESKDEKNVGTIVHMRFDPRTLVGAERISGSKRKFLPQQQKVR